MRWAIFCATLLVATLLRPALAATGDEPPTDPATVAIEKGKEGVAAYDRGDYQAALVLFTEADELYHSPVLVLYQARCQRKIGRLLDARSVYDRLAAEAIAADAPGSWKTAQADGASELQALRASIPSVRVAVRGASEGARATLDGHVIAIGATVELDPGPHRVVVEDGPRRKQQDLLIEPGEREREIEFDLTPVQPPPPTLPPKPPRIEPGPDGYFVLAVVLTSVGGAALLAGGVTGAVALAEARAAEKKLPLSCNVDLSCPSYDQGRVEETLASASDKAIAADVLLVAGGIMAAAGIVLLIVDPGHDATALDGGGLTIRF